MTDTKNTVSDERLAEMLEALTPYSGDFPFLPHELNDALTELQSLRASIPGGVGVKGLVTLPDRMHMDGATVKAINFMLGSSDEEDDTPTDAILWVGNLEGDEGDPVHGLHLANAEYPEEGSITLVEFAALSVKP